MKITETYQNNVKALDAYLKTFSFSEESEQRVRQFINDPLSVVNDDVKALFKKYDDIIIDYRLPLPASLMHDSKQYPEELYLILDTITDCLIQDKALTVEASDEGIKSNINLSIETVAANYFMINNGKRKVWKYLDSKAVDLAKDMIALTLAEHCNIFNLFKSVNANLGFCSYQTALLTYLNSLGTRKTSLRDKITDLTNDLNVSVSEDNTNAAILKVAEQIKTLFKIMSEIIGAKMIDASKFNLYLSFNAFDWLLASSAEDFHSCIDMQSTYVYGLGILGMTACPDWGMLLYSNGTTKKLGDIEALHIITRSWVCLTDKNEWQVINWYPKDIRGSVNIEANSHEDFKFTMARSGAGNKSKSSWNPITFCNGGVAWIYSDLNEFKINDDKNTVHFEMNGACGINNLYRDKDSKELCYHGNQNNDAIQALQMKSRSIYDAVTSGYTVKEGLEILEERRNNEYEDEEETYTCDICGETFTDPDELTYIESEDRYVCSSCLENDYYWCESCEEYHRYDDDCYEVYYGEEPWEYNNMCNSCVDEYAFYDDLVERYYDKDSVTMCTLFKGNDTYCVSEFYINKGIKNGTIEVVCEDDREYRQLGDAQ